MKKSIRRKSFIPTMLIAFINLSISAFSQSSKTEMEDQQLSATILHLDSLFWKSYNDCTTENSGQYLTENVKFYHDKGGITNGRTDLVSSIAKNICGNPDQKVRREAVKGTVKVYPLRNGDSIYGAVILGEHYFYVTEKGKPEERVGLAKFTQVWVLNNNQWQMTDIISYDHKPSPYLNQRKEIKIVSTDLKPLEGIYHSQKKEIYTIKRQGSNLIIDGPGFHSIIYPETKSKFFSKDRDLEFEFLKNGAKIQKLVIYEKGSPVEELLKN